MPSLVPDRPSHSVLADAGTGLVPRWMDGQSLIQSQPRSLMVDGTRATTEEILDVLALYGVVVVKEFVPLDSCTTLKGEFLRLMAQAESEHAPTFNKKNNSRFTRVLDTELDKVSFAAISSQLYSSRVAMLANGFYGANPYFLNKELYLTHDVDRMDFNGGWHLDPSRSLKFMLYLNDVTEKNGAMMYVPGSNYQAIYRIHYYRYRGMDEFPVLLPDNEVPVGRISLNWQAGTMVIFDTAGLHRAGNIDSGAERLVIRGHWYARPTLPIRIFNKDSEVPAEPAQIRLYGRRTRRAPLQIHKPSWTEQH